MDFDDCFAWHRMQRNARMPPIKRRSALIKALLLEIEAGCCPIAALYATLLIRTLARTDVVLMSRFARTIARLAPEQPRVRKKRRNRRGGGALVA